MIPFAAGEGTYVPTRPQYDLLLAALQTDREEVLAALARWKESVHFDDIEVGTLRMLPLLYRNLQQLAIDDPVMPRLKGIYRQVWFRNQLILRQGGAALRSLREAGIQALLIKGAALVATVYDDVALRPMEDFDVVVPRADFRRAAELLMSLGWRMDPRPDDLEPHLAFHHAISLKREEGGGELDLHWATTYGTFEAAGESEFWEKSRPGTLGGEPVRILAPPDQLLQVCVHATQRNFDVAPIRWIADAKFILDRAGDSFDWNRLVELARLRSLSLPQLRCLVILRDGFAREIPAGVLESLRRNVRLREYPLLRLRLASRRVQRWYAAMIWVRLLFLDGAGAVPRRLALLRRYLRSAFRVPRGTGLPGFIVRKIFRPPVASANPNRDTTRS